MTSLYQRLVDAQCRIDHHESDLYVKRDDQAMAIIAQFEAQGGVTNKALFTSAVDFQTWVELPFAYEPWWQARQVSPVFPAYEAADLFSGEVQADLDEYTERLDNTGR